MKPQKICVVFFWNTFESCTTSRNEEHLKEHLFFIYRYTNLSLGGQEIAVETQVCRASVSMLFRVIRKFYERFYNVWDHGKIFLFGFFSEITCRNLKLGMSFLYQNVNSPYRWRLRMRWRIMLQSFLVFHTVIETRILANRSSHFQKHIL